MPIEWKRILAGLVEPRKSLSAVIVFDHLVGEGAARLASALAIFPLGPDEGRPGKAGNSRHAASEMPLAGRQGRAASAASSGRLAQRTDAASGPSVSGAHLSFAGRHAYNALCQHWTRLAVCRGQVPAQLCFSWHLQAEVSSSLSKHTHAALLLRSMRCLMQGLPRSAAAAGSTGTAHSKLRNRMGQVAHAVAGLDRPVSSSPSSSFQPPAPGTSFSKASELEDPPVVSSSGRVSSGLL